MVLGLGSWLWAELIQAWASAVSRSQGATAPQVLWIPGTWAWEALPALWEGEGLLLPTPIPLLLASKDPKNGTWMRAPCGTPSVPVAWGHSACDLCPGTSCAQPASPPRGQGLMAKPSAAQGTPHRIPGLEGPGHPQPHGEQSPLPLGTWCSACPGLMEGRGLGPLTAGQLQPAFISGPPGRGPGVCLGLSVGLPWGLYKAEVKRTSGGGPAGPPHPTDAPGSPRKPPSQASQSWAHESSESFCGEGGPQHPAPSSGASHLGCREHSPGDA